MLLHFKKLLLPLSLLCMLASCSTEEESLSTNCVFKDAAIEIEPVCNFDPSQLTTVPFPVRVWYGDTVVDSDDHTFLWSSDSSFGGSAISVTYDQLPLTVSITEVSTGCVATTTLSADYWE